MSLRQRVFPVMGADVAVHVEEPERGAPSCDPPLGERPAELRGEPQGGEPSELAPQGLHLGCAVETEEAAEVTGRVLVERLGMSGGLDSYSADRSSLAAIELAAVSALSTTRQP